MNKFSRRQFLRTGGTLFGASLLGGIGIARDANAAGPDTTLISIHLSGGNDTLNTVIPYADPNYYAVRGGLAIPKSEVIPLNAQLGLHPALRPLKPLFDGGRMAIVNNVGYPRFNYSHFQAMRIHWIADPALARGFGWLGRSLDTLRVGVPPERDPLAGLNIGSDSQPSLLAKTFTAPLLPPNPDSFWMPRRDDRQFAAFSKIVSQNGPHPSGVFAQYVRNSRAGLGAYNLVKTAGALESGVTYPQNQFSESLRFVGKLLRVDSAVRFVALAQGSYDTHENQSGQHAAQLGELAEGLAAFFADLEKNGTANRVLVFLWSEFARRVHPNANLGTDHGSAQSMIVLGNGVKGGVIGNPPSLAASDLIDDGNLRMAVDFRGIYATLLDGWVGVNSSTVLGASWPKLPILL